MSIDFSKQVALWPSAQIKQRRDAINLYLIFVKDENTFNSIPALLQATDMAIIVAKIGDSFFAKVVDDSWGAIVNKHAITDAILINQFNTSIGDSDTPIESPTFDDLQPVTNSVLKNKLTNYLISNLSKQQDVYFQPGLTWTSKGTQGVALLFLENYTGSGDINKQDFRELVKGLVRWVWAAKDSTETSESIILAEDVQLLYNEFVNTPLSYENIKIFLRAHYHFKILECSTDMEGTVFPMFPHLEMIVGANPRVSFSPVGRKLDGNKVNTLRNFFSQLQVRFGTEGTSLQTINASSVTEFLFVGYIRLLIRNGLQAIMDYLKAGGDADNIVALLDNEGFNATYRNNAQMASRFLLNGFNLPEKLLGWNNPNDDEEGLYASTGQQYKFSDSGVPSKTPTEYRVTLQGDVTESFISFPEDVSDDKAQIVYSIPNTTQATHPLLKLANDLNGLTDANIAELHSAQPKLIPPYRTENLHFALRNRVKWGSSRHLLSLPTSLLHHLEQYEHNPVVDLRVWHNNDPRQAIDVPNDDFTWATRIGLTLQRVPNPDSDGFLNETYEIGSSSEKDKYMLEAVWKFLDETTKTYPIELNLLYISDEGGGTTNPTVTLVPGAQSDILLLKTNLSTETTGAPSADFSATLANKKDFLKMLWEALDVDTGGFYLYIPHGDENLDTTIFKGSNNAVFPLLIEFTNSSDPIHDFNNYAVFEEVIDVETDLVLARSDRSVPVLMIPPGFLGFQIDDRPEAFVVTHDAAGELSVLYQLLGWQVAAHTDFEASNPGLPIGPTELPSTTSEPSHIWLYERLVPVFQRLANPPAAGPSDLPPHAMNPYLGIGADSELKVETWWQDIYGNQLMASKAEQTFPIRYTDALIGINQWPSVSESYTFVQESDGSRKLKLTFAFDTSPYALDSHVAAPDPATSRANRIKADITTIEKVHYQLKQVDVGFKVTTSIDDSWVFVVDAVDKERIRAFIDEIYRYLDGNTSPGIPAPYTQDIDAKGINIRQDFIFPVTVEMEMGRNFALVSDDLKQTIKVTAGESLSQLAKSFTAVDLLIANSDYSDLFNAGTVLKPASLTPGMNLFYIDKQDWIDYAAITPALTLTIEAAEAPKSLAERFKNDMEAKLERTVNFSVTDLAAILANDITVLKVGTKLRLMKDEYENVLRVPATLSPKFEAISNEDTGLSLRPFAQNFQEAFPGILLAVSEDRQNRNRSGISQQPLYAVRLGKNGITYDIQDGQPTYYAIPPLSNVLLSGKVKIGDEDKQFNAVDLNVLARNFLVAIENFLDPATLIPAYRLYAEEVDNKVKNILQQKAYLAEALSDKILPVLDKDRDKVDKPKFKEAKEAIRQELLVDLVKGYDIETIVQFDVNVTVNNTLLTRDGTSRFEPPRIIGKAMVNGARVGEESGKPVPLNSLDFKLSTGKIPLWNDTGTSYFTYLFDTKTPGLFANLKLDLQFIPAEIEYDIQTLPGITDRQASNFLNFVLPEGLEQSMGSSAIPIPLREYPAPPSLILQKAEPDPTSLTELTDVRQWQYTIVYEHPDISQDSIDCIVQLNVPPVDSSSPLSSPTSQSGDLFAALVHFGETYPKIATDLNDLRNENLSTDNDLKQKVKKTLIAFESLISNVANAWHNWTTDIQSHTPAESDLHFVISEEAHSTTNVERQGLVTTLQTVASKIGGPAIEPTLALPGYKEKDAPIIDGETIKFTFEKDPDDLTFFGASSIPDRKFMIRNLDVIEHHNAWAKIWLSRNKDLIRDSDGQPLDTNPAFVFQTPAVRFSNMVTPFITNDEPWDIATLSQEQNRALEQHLTTMVNTLFPTFPGNKYEVRLDCRYAFSLATGKGLNEDLVTTLPILLGIQITPDALSHNYGAELSREIATWLRSNRPSTTMASLVFTVDLFSKLNDGGSSSMPTVRITHLELKLTDIVNLSAILQPTGV